MILRDLHTVDDIDFDEVTSNIQTIYTNCQTILNCPQDYSEFTQNDAVRIKDFIEEHYPEYII